MLRQQQLHRSGEHIKLVTKFSWQNIINKTHKETQLVHQSSFTFVFIMKHDLIIGLTPMIHFQQKTEEQGPAHISTSNYITPSSSHRKSVPRHMTEWRTRHNSNTIQRKSTTTIMNRRVYKLRMRVRTIYFIHCQVQIKKAQRFDVHMSVHRKYISRVQPTRCNVFSIYLFL
jgi:hypothetical protein